MTHEFRSLATAPHEVLGNALVAGGVAAVILLLIIGYFLWRDRKLKKPENRPRSATYANRKKRRR